MFPDGDLSRMQDTQELHMLDTCHRSVHAYTKDEYGAEKSSWTENSTDILCGIKQETNKSETVQSNMTVVNYDAIARMSIDQAEVWNIKDRLILTKRFGVAITSITYGIVAPIVRGPSGIRLILQKVEV